MYGWLREDAFHFEHYNFTYNSHTWSMNPDKFQTDYALMNMFNLTAISYMPDGRPIVASIESERYPFFGTQFHPEKSSRLFREDLNIDHSWLAIKMNRHFMDYFVYQTRQSPNTFGTFAETQKYIVQNYDTIISDDWFDTVYVFK